MIDTQILRNCKSKITLFPYITNVRTLAIEMYKVVNGMSPEIMNNIFKLRENTHYNLRHTSQFLVDPILSMFNGSESASNLRPKIWEQIPSEIKNINFLVDFKKENGNLRIALVEFGKFKYPI